MSQFRLDLEHERWRSRARAVSSSVLAPRATAVDADSLFPAESVAAVVDAGLHAVGLPAEYGGPGGGMLASVIVAEELARACTTTQQVVGGNELFAWPLLLAASDSMKRRFLPMIAQGNALGAFALSEPDAGSDVSAMRTRAVMTDRGWRITGTKRWITNAGRADLYVVFAVTDPQAGARGISAFVLEATDPGITVGALERKMGLKGSPTADLVLDVTVPQERLIGEPGQGLKLALGTLDRTRAVVAGQAVGVAQAAVDAVLSQGRAVEGVEDWTRSQSSQFLIADMECQTRAARLLAYAAAEEAEVLGTEMTLAGAVAKCFASDTAVAVTGLAAQLLGDVGYTADSPLERLFRDAKITQIYEGTNQIQRLVIARELNRSRVAQTFVK